MINTILGRYRALLAFCLFLLIAGAYAMVTINKEASPDVPIPMIYVSVGYEGVSPKDADQLLVRPIEKQLRGIEGVKEIKSIATVGHASLLVKFESEVDIDQALLDVRERVDRAERELPSGADKPTVSEINIGLFPILLVSLAGDVDERTLYTVARDVRRRIESLPNVFEVELAGEREEQVEVVFTPALFEGLDISLADVQQLIARNNQVIAAGSVDTGNGRISVKVPGLIEDVNDILDMPIKVDGDRVIQLRDVAFVQRTFKDATQLARFNGKPALVLEVKKRIGSNVIDTVSQVKSLVQELQPSWPQGITVSFSQDESSNIRSMLRDLYNNVLIATLLVMCVILCFLGVRSAFLVGIAIPGAFLVGVFTLYLLGLTMNIVVLFSLILSVGMLVDGAIVITEYADRRMIDGDSRFAAYSAAVRTLGWPVIAAVLTTLIVFMPLMFWPDIVGEFMKFLPLTLIITLTASLFMALLIVPAIGLLIGKPSSNSDATARNIHIIESPDSDTRQLRGFSGLYAALLRGVLRHPPLVLLAAVVLLVGTFMIYGKLNHGVEFFPDIEPERALVTVQTRGNLSIDERDAIVRKVEQHVLSLPEVKSVYTKVETEATDDDIGTISFEFIDWEQRRKAAVILAEIDRFAQTIPGVVIETNRERMGPPSGDADVNLEVTGQSLDDIYLTLDQLRKLAADIDGMKNIRDDRGPSDAEWQITVDREKAARYGLDIATVGSVLRLATNGVTVAVYRPQDSDDEVDIVLRFPNAERNIGQLADLAVPAAGGALVPIANVVTQQPVFKQNIVQRIDGELTHLFLADRDINAQTDQLVKAMQAKIDENSWPSSVSFRFTGEAEDQQRTGAFLQKAFLIALFGMFIVLLVQFNSLRHTVIILSAIVFSTIGMLWGLLITGKPFGIVMCGMGTIALAGIVVNNNIILIDAFRQLRKTGMNPFDAALRAGVQRLRPVLLTAGTTVLGLIPMVFQLNIDLLARSVTVGAPSSQWWVQLSTAIAGGLTFATVITLLFTPAMLVLGVRTKERWQARRQRRTTAATQ